MKISEELLKELRTAKGGYTRETLEKLGVPWPPPKGWKRKLLRGRRISPKKKKAARQEKSGRKDFYRTQEWAALRYEALSKNDGRCELCGRSKHEGAVLHVDHIKPIKTHPHLKAVATNLQVLCATCNWGKGNRHNEDWREPRLSVLMGERAD